MPIKKLAMEGIVLLSDVLVSLEPLIVGVGKALEIVGKIISPLLDLIGRLLEMFFKIDGALGKMLSPINAASSAFSNLSSKIKSAFSWSPPSWMSRMGIRGFQRGGTVPGSPGSPQLAVVHGGEKISTQAQARSGVGPASGGGGEGVVINITVNAGVGDPYQIGREIADILGEYSRQAGPIAVNTRPAD